MIQMVHEYELTVSYKVKVGKKSKHRIYQRIHFSIDGCLKKISELAKDNEIEFIVVTPFKSGDSDATI